MGLRYVTGENVLHQPLRARLVILVEERPGLIITEAAAALGVNLGTVKHHLRLLTRFGHVLPEHSGHDILLFPADGNWPRAQRAAVVRSRSLRNPVLQRALSIVRAQPGVTLAAVIRACGVKRASLRHHVNRLVGAGLVKEEASRDARGRRCVRLYPVPVDATRSVGSVAASPIPATRG